MQLPVHVDDRDNQRARNDGHAIKMTLVRLFEDHGRSLTRTLTQGGGKYSQQGSEKESKHVPPEMIEVRGCPA